MMRTILKRLKSVIGFSLSRNWEDAGLMLSAKSLMNSAGWLDAPNYSDPFWVQNKEFKVYSQFGDDGIIQWLVNCLGLSRGGRFIEFGVGDYFESNTHFLLVNNRWLGYIIDGDVENINTIKNSSIYWRFRLNAIQHFITKENIRDLLNMGGFNKVELLHIDLDGNDYWILKELDLMLLDPDILILEYNSLFGVERPISIPYDPHFYRKNAHFSGKYFGASLLALSLLAESKDYYFIGCNSAGNNAYFLAKRHIALIPQTDISSGFQQAGYREARDKDGRLSFVDASQEYEALKGLPVVNVVTTLQERI